MASLSALGSLVLLGFWSRLCGHMHQPWWARGPGGYRLANCSTLGSLVLLGAWDRPYRSMTQPWWAGGLVLSRCSLLAIEWRLIRWAGTRRLCRLS